MVDIETLTVPEFRQLPLVTEGESKEVRYAGEGEVVIKLKPTIYSFTHNRAGIIEGSDRLRLQAIQKIMPVIIAAGLEHTYREVNDHWITSELVLQPDIQGKKPAFRPDDLSQKEIDELPVAPPIEVIAKARHTGTSKHRYFDLPNHPTRFGNHISVDAEYPESLIRFDWRNPMWQPDTGIRLADEILPEPMADWFIDTKTARYTAHTAFKALSDHFQKNGLDLWDICFFISQDGDKLFGEISPDCMRVRSAGGSSLDKDVWRAGGSHIDVMQKWQALVDALPEPQLIGGCV